jgi:hypothetical protein
VQAIRTFERGEHGVVRGITRFEPGDRSRDEADRSFDGVEVWVVNGIVLVLSPWCAKKLELAADLLRELLHVSVPAFTEARLAEASLNELVPTEYRADAVVLLVHGTPVFGIILEAQLGIDPDKPFTWPMYAVSARARYRCPFVVLVVTPDPTTARWAGQPVDLGGDTTWKALVVGPEVFRSLRTRMLQRASRSCRSFRSWLADAMTTFAPSLLSQERSYDF